jgi:quercetin dioxygenase-like cupin family protein
VRREEMKVVAASDVTLIETPNGNYGGAVGTPSTGAQEVSVIRQRQEPGGYNPPHSHDREEVMAILGGTVIVRTDHGSDTLTGGDAVIIPARTMHRVENAGQDCAEWLLIATTGIRFFHATGEEATPPWSR